jgi:hypothetical protein
MLGLVKPLLDGDNGTPLSAPDVDGDLDNMPESRRRWLGVPLVYMCRVGVAKCGRVGE